jgi:hypothetical protein
VIFKTKSPQIEGFVLSLNLRVGFCEIIGK